MEANFGQHNPSQAKGSSIRQLTSHYSNTSLFTNEAKIKLCKLTVASQQDNDFENEIKETVDSQVTENVATRQHTISDVMFCNCCQTDFSDREEQLTHYRCDWHRYNLHLRLKGLKCVTENEFELVSGDVSSISGSDDESTSEEDESNPAVLMPVTATPIDVISTVSHKEQRFHKIFFNNEQGELISLYRCLLSHKKNPFKSSSELVAAASQVTSHKTFAVLMISSGHFAGAIFDGKEVVDHKTFHRYTVRAKRGSAQSSRDGHGNAPKSAGASLRRYNEAALNQEVQDLMKSWQNHLSSCSLIFVRIPVANRALFYGGKHPVLKKDDLRIRIVPFPTRRPTFSEVKRVHQMLSCIECYGQEADVNDFIPLSPQRFYCKETNELKIKPTQPQTPKSKPNPVLREICPPQKMDDDSKLEQEVDQQSEESSEDELYPAGPGNPLKEFEMHLEKKRKRRRANPVKKKAVDENHDETSMKNSLFTACKTGNIEDLRTILCNLHIFCSETSPSEDIQQGTDTAKGDGRCNREGDDSHTNGRSEDSVLSNKCDETVNGNDRESISRKKMGDFLSCKLGDSANCLLHYASQASHHEIISILLHEGADPAVKNKKGKVPYNLGNNEVKNTYRRFMALFPDKYDYRQAQIPSPLTPEMETLRKQKTAEKRTVKKKSMQEKNKVKKAEELKTKEENEMKERFVNLSDREKRALAAERRLLQHHSDQGNAKPVLSRCFQCGADITGKVPFEYSDFKFCTTKCLRDHRAKPKVS